MPQTPDEDGAANSRYRLGSWAGNILKITVGISETQDADIKSGRR